LSYIQNILFFIKLADFATLQTNVKKYHATLISSNKYPQHFIIKLEDFATLQTNVKKVDVTLTSSNKYLQHFIIKLEDFAHCKLM